MVSVEPRASRVQAVLKAIAVHWRCVLRQLVAAHRAAQDECSSRHTIPRAATECGLSGGPGADRQNAGVERCRRC